MVGSSDARCWSAVTAWPSASRTRFHCCTLRRPLAWPPKTACTWVMTSATSSLHVLPRCRRWRRCGATACTATIRWPGRPTCWSRTLNFCNWPVSGRPTGSPGPAVRNPVVSSTALDSFLDKRRSRWPEWSVAALFVAEPQRELAVAWFALLQEFDDMLNTSGDPLPADAKLAWWGEELRSWAGHRSRHPLGRLLEPVRAPWVQLAEALPDLVEARTVALDAAGAERALANYADAVAAVEAALFADKPRTGAGRAVQLQTLAQRLQDAGAGVPRSLLDEDSSTAAQRWAQYLLKGWGSRVPGPRPRRVCGRAWRAPALPRRPQASQSKPPRCARCCACGGPRAVDRFWWVRTLIRILSVEPSPCSARLTAPAQQQPSMGSALQKRTPLQRVTRATYAPAPATGRCGCRTSSCPSAGAGRWHGRWRRRQRSPGPAPHGRQLYVDARKVQEVELTPKPWSSSSVPPVRYRSGPAKVTMPLPAFHRVPVGTAMSMPE